jgi:hypothetical protein
MPLYEQPQGPEDEKDLAWLGARPQRARHDGKGSTGRGKRQSDLGSAGIVGAWADAGIDMSSRAQWERDGNIDLLTEEFDELLDIDIRQIDGQHRSVRASDPNDTI